MAMLPPKLSGVTCAAVGSESCLLTSLVGLQGQAAPREVCPFPGGNAFFSVVCQSVGAITELQLNAGDCLFPPKKQSQLGHSATSFSAVPCRSLRVLGGTAGDRAGVSEPGLVLQPPPRPPPVPTVFLQTLKRHYPVPAMCQALCWVWVGWAECPVMKTQKGTSLALGDSGKLPEGRNSHNGMPGWSGRQ